MSAHTPMAVTLEQSLSPPGSSRCRLFVSGRHVANLNLRPPEAEELKRVIDSHAALLAAAEEILPCCIDEWGRDDPDVEALIAAVAAAKGEAP